PPDFVREWLDQGWDDPSSEISHLSSRNRGGKNGITIVEEFADDIVRVEAFETWVRLRNRWAEQERPARETLKVFTNLREIHSRLKRESELLELMLGDGILRVKSAQ